MHGQDRPGKLRPVGKQIKPLGDMGPRACPRARQFGSKSRESLSNKNLIPESQNRTKIDLGKKIMMKTLVFV